MQIPITTIQKTEVYFILTAKFTNNIDKTVVYGLTQYDKNIILQVEGLNLNDTLVQVHFANNSAMEAIVYLGAVNDNVLTVNIPNTLIIDNSAIYAWIYVNQENTGKTIKTIIMPIVSRNKPASFVEEPDETENYQIEKILNYIKYSKTASPKNVYQSVEELQSANPDAGFYVVYSDCYVYYWDNKTAEKFVPYQSGEITQDIINNMEESLNTKLNVALSEKADTASIPTALSQLNNDKGFPESVTEGLVMFPSENPQYVTNIQLNDNKLVMYKQDLFSDEPSSRKTYNSEIIDEKLSNKVSYSELIREDNLDFDNLTGAKIINIINCDNVQNAPDGVTTANGTLFNCIEDVDDGVTVATFQIYIHINSNTIYKRYKYYGDWQPWVKVADDLSQYVLQTELPTNLSQLTNDIGYIKKVTVRGTADEPYYIYKMQNEGGNLCFYTCSLFDETASETSTYNSKVIEEKLQYKQDSFTLQYGSMTPEVASLGTNSTGDEVQEITVKYSMINNIVVADLTLIFNAGKCSYWQFKGLPFYIGGVDNNKWQTVYTSLNQKFQIKYNHSWVAVQNLQSATVSQDEKLNIRLTLFVD
jgi:hypothetical protein